MKAARLLPFRGARRGPALAVAPEGPESEGPESGLATLPLPALDARPPVTEPPRSVTPPGTAGGQLYGLVAWPSRGLDCWLRQVQERLGVRAFGEPHLNLRAPFYVQDGPPGEVACCAGSEAERRLVGALRALVRSEQPFEVRVVGWRFFPHVVFLECEAPALTRLHSAVLALPGAPLQPHDHKTYIPHLTLALGVLPWAEEGVRAEVERLLPPETTFTVSALSLTREDGGELREVHTFPLGGTETP